jgi:tRNA(Ile)-lysidine synthase
LTLALGSLATSATGNRMAAEPLEAAFRAAWPIERWADVPVVVGVSGGADSVALLRLIVAARHARESIPAGECDESIIVAHVNHGLRGEASDEDARFVRSLCDQLHVAASFIRMEAMNDHFQGGEGLESNCRKARYEFILDVVASKFAARYIAVAHTADDQAETILHHALRGTGVAGLGGMTMFRAMNDAVTLARPLLNCRRADVVAYLKSIGQTWREDATNHESTFTRNRLRNELIPQLARQYNPDIVPALNRLGEQARDAHDVVRQFAETVAEQCVKRSNGDDDVVLDCSPLAGVHRHVVREMFVLLWREQDWPRQSMGYDEWDALAAMALGEPSQSASRTFPGNVSVTRDGGTLKLKRRGQQ